METEIFNSYAIAFLDYAIELDKVESLRSEIKELRILLKENPSFKDVLSFKDIENKEKYEIIDKVFISCSKSLRNYIKVITKNNLSFHLYEIIRETLYRFDDYLSIEEGFIYVSEILSDNEKEKIIKKIETKINKKVDLEVIIDPSIIGGFIVKLRNNIYDASIKGKLNMIKNDLIGE